MLNRPIEAFVVDVLIFIQKIKRATVSYKTFEDLLIDSADLFDGTMHNLELMGEALKHILNDQNVTQHINPEWRVIVDFRNVIAHHYFGVEFEEIYRVLTIDVPIFEQEFMRFVEKIRHTPAFKEVIAAAKTELAVRKKAYLLEYLEKLQRECQSLNS